MLHAAKSKKLMKMCIIRASLVLKGKWQQKEKRTRKEHQKVEDRGARREKLMKAKIQVVKKKEQWTGQRIRERKIGQRRYILLHMVSTLKKEIHNIL